MSSLTIALLILWGLLDSAYSRQCYSCHEKLSQTCVPTVIDCGDKPCLTHSEFYMIDGNVSNTIYKGCSDHSKGEFLSVTVPRMTIKVNAEVCHEEKCNDGPYHIPPDAGPNGLLCPSCFEMDSKEECTSDKKMCCTGGEDKCINYIGTAVQPDGSKITKSFKGCVSKLGCILRFAALKGITAVENLKFECTDPSVH